MSSHPILTFIPYFQGIVCTFLEFIKKEVDQLQFEVLQLIFEKWWFSQKWITKSCWETDKMKLVNFIRHKFAKNKKNSTNVEYKHEKWIKTHRDTIINVYAKFKLKVSQNWGFDQNRTHRPHFGRQKKNYQSVKFFSSFCTHRWVSNAPISGQRLWLSH